jgi:hypothetical protein
VLALGAKPPVFLEPSLSVGWGGFPLVEPAHEVVEDSLPVALERCFAIELAIAHCLDADHEDNTPHLQLYRGPNRVEFCDRPQDKISAARSRLMPSCRSILSAVASARHCA